MMQKPPPLLLRFCGALLLENYCKFTVKRFETLNITNEKREKMEDFFLFLNKCNIYYFSHHQG